MKWKYIYDVLRQRSALSRCCGVKGNAVADECDLAIKMLKQASRQKIKVDQKTPTNKAKGTSVLSGSDNWEEYENHHPAGFFGR